MRQGTARREGVLELKGEGVSLRDLLAGLWRHRFLLPLLARKSFLSRYRSASLGVAWSVLLPLMQGTVLALVFSRIVRIEVAYNYPVFVIGAMVTWSYFNTSLTSASSSIVDGSAIAAKVYFPRLILPAVAPVANLVGYLFSLVTVVILMLVVGVPVRPTIVLLPVVALLAALLAISLGAVVAVAHVYFRDVRQLLQASILMWFYATPVIYPIEMTGRLQPLFELNPVTGLVQLVRYSVFGEATAVLACVRSTVVVIVVALVAIGFLYTRHDRVAVDRL